MGTRLYDIVMSPDAKHVVFDITAEQLKEFAVEIANATAKAIAKSYASGHYTAKELMERFHVSRATICNWEKQGKLTGQQIAGRKCYLKEEVDSMAESGLIQKHRQAWRDNIRMVQAQQMFNPTEYK